MYKKVNIKDDDDEIAVDASGYTGNFFRSNEKNLKPCDMETLVKIFVSNNKLVDVMRSIKEIDKEHNGYVTSTELDDILKICYK